jgi:hypothetical protein
MQRETCGEDVQEASGNSAFYMYLNFEISKKLLIKQYDIIHEEKKWILLILL